MRTQAKENVLISPQLASISHAATACFADPQPDWVSLHQAPYFCNGNFFSRSGLDGFETWTASLLDRLRNIASELPTSLMFDRSVLGHEMQEHITKPEWQYAVGRDGVSVEALGVNTWITQTSIHIWPRNVWNADRTDGSDWVISVLGLKRIDRAFLKDRWDDEVWYRDRLAAEWHRLLFQNLVQHWSNTFVNSLRAGAATIMARPSSPLAPFAQISWDQWQYFDIEDYDLVPTTVCRGSGYFKPATAVGPNGERLYSIHVVAADRPQKQHEENPEQKCQQWLTTLLRSFPDCRPKPLAELAEEAMCKFPGLSKNGFGRSYVRACEETGNRNWSRAGAPRKITSEIPAKKINPAG